MQNGNGASQLRKSIYLIDDEFDSTTILKKILEQNKFTVNAFNDPRKALEEFRENGKDHRYIV